MNQAQVLQDIIDKHLITEVLTRYVLAIDSGLPDLLRECFTADADLDYGAFGRYDVEGFVALSRQSMPTFDNAQHFLSLPRIKLDGDKAYARTYCLASHSKNALASEPTALLGVYYDDELRRENGQWRISKRTEVAQWINGNTQVFAVEGLEESAHIRKGAFKLDCAPYPL